MTVRMTSAIRWGLGCILALCLASPMAGKAMGPKRASQAAGPATGQLNASHDLVPLGIAATNMVPNQPGLDARPLLAAAVDYAKSHSIGLVTVDTGAYYFKSLQQPDRHLQLSQLNNITIDLNGSDVFLTHTEYLGIVLDSSTNAVLQNFTLDYVDVPFTQLRVETVDAANRRIGFSVQPGWRHPSVFNAPLNPFSPQSVYAFVFRDGQPAADLTRMETDRPFTGDTFTIKDIGEPWTASQVLARIQPGDIVVLTARGGGDPIFSNECSGCTFRNIKIYSSGVNGIALMESASSLLERVYVMPRPGTDRLISSNADGITLHQPRAGNTIRLSRAIRTADDGFSPHSLLLGTVASQMGPRRLSVQRQYSNRVFNGSPVVFQRPSDGVMLGSAVIAAQNPPPTTYAFGGSITIDFTSDLPGGLAGSVLYTVDPNQRGANTVLERNMVQDQVFARGITLWGLVNSTVRANYVWHSQMAALLGTHRLFDVDWMSPPLSNVSITGNVIDGANRLFGTGILEKMAGIEILAQKADFQPMLVSPHDHIAVTGNFIADPARSGVRVQNTATGSIGGNYLLNPNDRPGADGYWEDTFEPYQTEFRTPIVIKTSTDVTDVSNTVDKTSARLFASDSQSRRLAAYAPGSLARVNSYGIGQTGLSQLTIADADGTVRPIDILSMADHYLDVRLPGAMALGPGIITATLGGKKWIGTLFVDSADNVPLTNGCTYLVSPASTSAPLRAGTLAVLVVTQPACAYGVRTFDSFVTAGTHSPGTGVVDLSIAANSGPSRVFTVEIAGERLTLMQTGHALAGDFDGDTKSDITVYRPASGLWYVLRSNTNYTSSFAQAWGLSTDIPVPGDYDGDGKMDFAVYRPSTGVWYAKLSSTNYAASIAEQWGLSTDVPVPGDYDGDGKMDLAVYRPSTGVWYAKLSSTSYTTYIAQQWGLSTDRPVPGDYDGDGKTDLGIYRPSTGIWYVELSSTGYATYTAQQWGLSTDVPVAGDYDGDGKMDFAVYRPSTGVWYARLSSTNYATSIAQQWGLSTDRPVPGDYDGDGKTDLGIYRPSTGIWYVELSSTRYTTFITQQWGLSTDIPLPTH